MIDRKSLEGLHGLVIADKAGKHESPSLERFPDQNSLPFSTSLRTLAYLSTGGVVKREQGNTNGSAVIDM